MKATTRPSTRPSPDLILAHVKLMRSADQLLAAADKLRAARDDMEKLFAAHPARTGDVPQEARRDAT